MYSSKKSVKRNTFAKNQVTEISQLEARFNFFVSQALAVITVIDNNGIIFYQSPSVKSILGYDHQKRIGKNFLHSHLVHPDDVVIKERLLEMSRNNPDKNFQDELRMLHKNGTWSWMEVIFNNQLHNPDIAGIIVVTHDITKRKLLELQKNEFLSILSHELKTPLTTVRAFSQLLIKKMEKENDKEQKISFLTKIITQTDKITHLINDLLDVSKLQEEKLPIQKKTFQMHSLVKKIIDDFHYISNSHTISYKSHTKSFVLGDENRIGQVIINLLTNAIKYSPGSKKIVIHILKKEKSVITSVKDYGEGIPLNKQKYVFQRYFRIQDDISQQTSLGLGLYISSEIIRLHGGKIWLESKKGKGSTFYFNLPAVKKS